MYYPDIFYKVGKLPLEKKIKIIEKAKDLSFEWRVDKLDCSESWSRQKIDMSYEEIMGKFDDSCHFVLIYRKGYDYWKDKEMFNHRWCGEIAFTTMASVSYYLWVYVSEEDLDKLVHMF